MAEIEVYRAKEVRHPRPESTALIGRRLRAADRLKDLRRAVAVAGYSTWGTPTVTSVNGYGDLGFRYLYVGRFDVQRDDFASAGLHYMHARHYHPEFGRFLQPDPSALEANLYGYTENSPVTKVDPSGELSCLALLPLTAAGPPGWAVEGACWAALAGLAYFGIRSVVLVTEYSRDRWYRDLERSRDRYDPRLTRPERPKPGDDPFRFGRYCTKYGRVRVRCVLFVGGVVTSVIIVRVIDQRQDRRHR